MNEWLQYLATTTVGVIVGLIPFFFQNRWRRQDACCSAAAELVKILAECRAVHAGAPAIIERFGEAGGVPPRQIIAENMLNLRQETAKVSVQLPRRSAKALINAVEEYCRLNDYDQNDPMKANDLALNRADNIHRILHGFISA